MWNFWSVKLEDIPWEGSVVLAKPDKIIINRGEREGVNQGARFDVGGIEELLIRTPAKCWTAR
ncbi:MAG: hypothetical protein R2861_01610 [Desulfobacterales bacterium]